MTLLKAVFAVICTRIRSRVSINEASDETLDRMHDVIQPGCRDEELSKSQHELEPHGCPTPTAILQRANSQRNDTPSRVVTTDMAIANMKHEERSEEQFLQSHCEQAVGRLAGGIAHEFNNILTIILGNCDLLMMEHKQGGDPAERTDEIKKAAERGVNMTRQLLAYGGKQVPQPAVLDLNSIVHGMESMLNPLIDGQIRLETILDPNLTTVQADPTQIEYVLTNLIVNALDAMPDGGTVTVRTRNILVDAEATGQQIDPDPGVYAEVSISDTGQGIPQDLHKSLFEPFFTTKEKGKGTGLGLSTCLGIVKQSGGQISFVTEVGNGTTFKVILPRVQDETSV